MGGIMPSKICQHHCDAAVTAVTYCASEYLGLPTTGVHRCDTDWIKFGHEHNRLKHHELAVASLSSGLLIVPFLFRYVLIATA